MSITEKIATHLMQVAPHQKERQQVKLLTEALDEIIKLQNLKLAVENMMAQLGADGDISTRSELVLYVMDRLHDVNPV